MRHGGKTAPREGSVRTFAGKASCAAMVGAAGMEKDEARTQRATYRLAAPALEFSYSADLPITLSSFLPIASEANFGWDWQRTCSSQAMYSQTNALSERSWQ